MARRTAPPTPTRQAADDRLPAVAWPAGALLVGLPLAVAPGGLLPFLPPKWLVLCTVVPLGLAVAAWHRRLTLPAGRWWAALLAVLALATVTGVAPWMSLAGSPQRNAGWLASALGAGACALGASGADRRSARFVLRAALITGGVVGALALADRAGLALPGLGSEPVTRARSTWGSATFTAGHLVLVGPLAVVHLTAADPRWRRAGIAATIAMAGGLVATGTRGAWLGALAAAVVLWRGGDTGTAVEPGGRGGGLRGRRRPAPTRAGPGSAPGRRGAVPVAVVVGAAAVVAVAIAAAPSLTRATAGGRLDVWRVAVTAVGERPWLGSGPDSGRIVLPAAIDADFERAHGSDELHDRAHNLVLDTALAAGGAGVLALGALLVAVGRRAVRAARRGRVARAVAAGLVGYLVHLQVAFPEATLDPIAWLLAGLLVGGLAPGGWAGDAPGTDRSTTGPSTVGSPTVGRAVVGAAGFGVLAVAGLLWAGGEVRADQRMARAADQRAAGALAEAHETLAGAHRSAPARFDVRQARARLADQRLALGGDPSLARGALADIDAALDVARDDPELLIDRASILADAGRLDEARRAYQQVLAGPYPHSWRAHLGLGVVAARAGDPSGAIDAWETAADLAPGRADPWLNVGQLEGSRGRSREAVEAYRKALAADPGSLAAAEALRRLDAGP